MQKTNSKYFKLNYQASLVIAVYWLDTMIIDNQINKLIANEQ